MRLQIVEGEGAVNNLKQRTAREPIVEVTDSNHKPVGGAAVTFLLPESGAGGSFSGSGNVLRVLTDGKGRAIGRGFRPNSVPGSFKIQVTASYQGQSVGAVISQTNVASVAAAGGAAGGAGAAGASAGGVSTGVIVGVAGGAAAAAAVAAKVATGGDSATAGVTPPLVSGTIGTPGTPVFGPLAVGGSTTKSAGRTLAAFDGAVQAPGSGGGISAAKAGIIAGAATGAALGTWWYLQHRRDSSVSVSPRVISFGKLTPGQRGNAVILCTNRSSKSVVITELSTDELFSVASAEPLPAVVEPGRTVVLRVAFQPRAVGVWRSRVGIIFAGSHSAGVRRLSVDVRGEALQPSGAASAVAGSVLLNR